MRQGASFGWRALIGWIHSYGMLHQGILDRHELLPDGFGVLYTTLGKRDQSAEETEAALTRLESYADLLAKNGAEYFVVNSSPMVTHGGPGADKKIIASLESTTGRTGTTTTTSGVRALKAMGARRIAMASPYAHVNPAMQTFLEAEGFEIVGSAGLSEDLTVIHRLPAEFAYRVGRDAARSADRPDALYMPGGRLRVLEVLEELESDIGIPVVASTPAVVWEIKHFFGVTTGVDGFGQLLRDTPKHAVY